MVPDGWSELSLAESAKVIDCKHRTPKYVDQGVPLISPGTIKWGEIDLVSPTKRVTQEEYKLLMDHCVVEVGDLVLSRNQSVGVASYIVNNKPFVLGQDTVLIKPLNNNAKFIYFLIQSEVIQRKILSLSGGSTFSRINLGDIRKLKLELPSFPEQSEIAKILTIWDKAITTTEKLLANSQQQKKSLMQKLLMGKKRFDAFKENWINISIKNIGKVVAGGTPDTKSSKYWNGDIAWMTPTDVTALKNRYIRNTARKITAEGVKNSSATLLPSGTLLVCTRATVGLMSISTAEITTNQGFKNIIPNDDFDVNFLYYLFSLYKNEFIRHACGSTFLELSKKDFEKLSFECPEYKEQKKIASVLSLADDEIENLQLKIDCLKQEKKALMQQLLTGKRRVSV